jgi:hypothetical protein
VTEGPQAEVALGDGRGVGELEGEGVGAGVGDGLAATGGLLGSSTPQPPANNSSAPASEARARIHDPINNKDSR